MKYFMLIAVLAIYCTGCVGSLHFPSQQTEYVYVPVKKRVITYHHVSHANVYKVKRARYIKKRRHKHFVKRKARVYIHSH